MQVKKKQSKLDREQQTGSKSERSTSRLCIVPCLFNLYAEYIMRNARLDETKAGIKIGGRNINNVISVVQMTPPLWQKTKKNYRAS